MSVCLLAKPAHRVEPAKRIARRRHHIGQPAALVHLRAHHRHELLKLDLTRACSDEGSSSGRKQQQQRLAGRAAEAGMVPTDRWYLPSGSASTISFSISSSVMLSLSCLIMFFISVVETALLPSSSNFPHEGRSHVGLVREESACGEWGAATAGSKGEERETSPRVGALLCVPCQTPPSACAASPRRPPPSHCPRRPTTWTRSPSLR